VERMLDLDLRKDTDLARSHLLHRLTLLDVPWGRAQRATGQRGTFHEIWMLQWRPERAGSLIEAAARGKPVAPAAAARASDAAARATELTALTGLLEQVILADLGDSVGTIMDRLQEEAAAAPDSGRL